MLDLIFALIAVGMNSTASAEGDNAAVAALPQPGQQQATAMQSATIGEGVTVGESVTMQGSAAASGGSLLEGTADNGASVPAAPAKTAFNMAVVPAGLVAEPQTPSGKFTTAAEVKPILNATKGNWVAVREYDGKDLLYVTHLWGWRCGLAAMAISVNDEPMQNWPLPPCHTQFSTPNAVLEDDGLPYLSLRLGSVEKIDIQIVYDDLSMDKASFQRGDVLIP